MGFFKKSYQKNVTRDDQFFKNYAIKLNALLRYTEDNAKVTEAIQKLQNDFQYTVASANRKAKKNERSIDTYYEQLKGLLQHESWDESQVLLIIRNMGAEIDEINAMR